jgi:Mannosyl-glycoprotein endo-beta-N-acetylglucosaminidase
MAADQQTQSFINAHLNEARIAAGQIGMPVSVILAQWINETGAGTSSAFRNGHNYAGVSLNGQVESYPDDKAGLVAYIIRWGNRVYHPTTDAIHQAGNVKADPYLAARLVEQSPWAAGHYGGNGLEKLIAQDNLSQYDAGGSVPPPLDIQRAVNNAQDPGAVDSGIGAVVGGSSNIDPTTGRPRAGCPEGNLITMPGPIPNVTRCMGRGLLGGVSIASGLLVLGIGLGVLALGSRPGRALTSAATRV